jgi:DNA polymerase III subunit alpha
VGSYMPFVHLQVHSAYSLLNSTIRIEDLVEKAKELNFKALALTDENVMYGVIPFYKACLKHGIKPLIGLTASILGEDQKAYPLVLIATNNEGYRNLIKISSIVQTKSKEGLPKKWLPHYANGLIAITHGRNGEIEQALLRDDFELARKIVQFYQSVFAPDSFFLALQNHGLAQQEALNKKIIMLSREMNVKVTATNEVHYLEKNEAFVHECLLSIKHGSKLSDEDRPRMPSNEFYLKPASEMVDLFSEYPEALETTLMIAEQCKVHIDLGKTLLPKYPVPQGKSADEYLKELCYKGLKERIKQPNDIYVERLSYELDVIKRMKFSDYFLIVWDFMKYARDQGILTGPGRGSAAGSLVAYVLYITDVDPIQHDLLFERFLNPERISMPDIDIDFPDHRRDEMIEYVAKKYGQLHVAQIITFGTLAARAAIRDVARVMGMSPKEMDSLSKLIPSRLGITLKEALAESPVLRERMAQSPLVRKIFETAEKIEGLPRHTSTHAAGVVISEKPLTEIVPIQEGHQEIYLTQFSMDVLEELGLLKMDFLGLRNLTLIENILSLIYRSTGKRIQLQDIPFDDPKTFQLLSAGDTTGIFQLESEGMRKVLMRLKPNNLEDIVAVNALYRPGPMENIPLFIERKHGKKPIEYPHPDLEPILKKTYGVIVYQEQIMQIASKMAGFSLGEADLLRRAVGKKKKEILDKEREHFVNGCKMKGYNGQTAQAIYDLIVRFANYGFNRSHAVAYSMIAYHLAYLKANYPLYFMAALLSSVIGNEEKTAHYVREAKEQHLVILAPSINKSHYMYGVEKGGIRFSLAAVKNVGASAYKEIIQARRKKPFEDLFDFCLRVPLKKVNRRTIESLIAAGAFDEFNVDRAVLLASLDVAIEHAELVRPDDENQMDLFEEENFSIKPKYVEVEPMQLDQKLALEKEALGFYLSSHPTTPYMPLFQKVHGESIQRILSRSMPGLARVGIYVSSHRTIRTKKGEVMAFLTISDESGDMDAVAFPNIYAKYSKLLTKGEILFLEGTVEQRDDRQQFVIKKVISIQELTQQYQYNEVLFLKIEENRRQYENLQEVKKVLKENPGNVNVLVYYEREKRTIQLQKEYAVEPNLTCLERLKQLLGDQNVVLKKEFYLHQR